LVRTRHVQRSPATKLLRRPGTRQPTGSPRLRSAISLRKPTRFPAPTRRLRRHSSRRLRPRKHLLRLRLRRLLPPPRLTPPAKLRSRLTGPPTVRCSPRSRHPAPPTTPTRLRHSRKAPRHRTRRKHRPPRPRRRSPPPEMRRETSVRRYRLRRSRPRTAAMGLRHNTTGTPGLRHDMTSR